MEKRKKILFIVPQPFFEVRGTPIAIRDMLNTLAADYDIDLLSYPFGVANPITHVTHHRSAALGFRGVKIGLSVKKIFLDFGLFLKAFKMAIGGRYDYVHAVEEAVLAGIWIKKLTGAKLVYDMDSIMSEQVANSKYAAGKFLFSSLERSGIRNASLILGISGNFREYCQLAKPDCNFVEIFDIPQTTKAPLPEELQARFSGPGKKVLYVGNKEKYQGLSLIEKVAPLMPDVRFFTVGTGDDATRDNLTFIPRVPIEHVWGIMQAVDVLISPRYEGTNTPMKVYTYMASGKPIVATDIPAHNILRDCSFIVSRDPASLRQGILNALADDGTVAARAAGKVETTYNQANMESIIRHAYQAI